MPVLPIDAFSLLTGLASLFGFAIQAFDLFPRFGKARQVVFALVLGVFIGSMLRAIEPASIRFNFEVTGFTAFIAAFIVIIAGLLVAAAATTDARKRGELFGAAGLGFMGFIFTAFMGSLMTGAATSPAAERARLTITELKLLSDESAKLRDFERAVEHLKAIEARLSSNDPRRVVIKEQVQALQSKAVQ